MAERLQGAAVRDHLKEKIQKECAALTAAGSQPCLEVIRVGQRPDDLFYEAGVLKNCAALGLNCQVTELPAAASQQQIAAAVSAAGANPGVHGILMFSPLPKTIDEAAIRALIPVEKDVDCLTLASAARVFAGQQQGFAPCTPAAVIELLHYYQIPLKGKKAVVLGRSMVVGKPLAMLLLNEHATVTICHSRTENLPQVCQQADILIAAVGKAKLVDENYVRPGQIVIDVGINPDPDQEGKMCGDVDYDKVEPIVAGITPVPGGVGSVTTAVLCWHTAQACAATKA